MMMTRTLARVGLWIGRAGFCLAVACPACAAQPGSGAHTITFKVAQFDIASELQLHPGKGLHPVVIVVHGDGGGTRRSYRAMRERFVAAGYATFIWDKPGGGDSTGAFTDGRVLSERAAILAAAVNVVKAQPGIDRRRVGVWGVSQAGYVVSMALDQGASLAFAVLVGAPGENGIEQTAYFVGRQARCEGAPEDVAAEADALAARVMGAETYEDYAAAGVELLDRFPLVKVIDFMAGVLPRDRWHPRHADGESFVDPVGAIEKARIPTLVFFGELDTNVDPVQGAAAYRAAFARSGSGSSRVVVLPGVDHDMVPSETGCLRERNARTSWQAAPAYLDAMVAWLGGIDGRR